MKVKICGITTEEDAAMCEVLGADMLGFVHVRGRPRSLPLERIAAICSGLGPSVMRVLVCSPPDAYSAVKMLEKSETNVLQLCCLDPESTMSLREMGVNVMRMVRPVVSEAKMFASAVDCLVYEGGVPGTGTSYDYSQVPVGTCSRELIAGGLTPANVQDVIPLNPFGVDVSSGVETTPGRKDPYKVAEFIRRCRE